jgi:hypothetical protein
MGGACSTYGEKREIHTGFSLGRVKERDHLETPRSRWEDKIKLELNTDDGIRLA